MLCVLILEIEKLYGLWLNKMQCKFISRATMYLTYTVKDIYCLD